MQHAAAQRLTAELNMGDRAANQQTRAAQWSVERLKDKQGPYTRRQAWHREAARSSGLVPLQLAGCISWQERVFFFPTREKLDALWAAA